MQPDGKRQWGSGQTYAGYECEECGHIEYRDLHDPDWRKAAGVFIDCPKCKQCVAITGFATPRNSGNGMNPMTGRVNNEAVRRLVGAWNN